MRRLLAPACAAAALAGLSGAAQSGIEFEPKVGAANTRVTIRTTVPAGGQVLFGGRPVNVIEEAKGIYSFQVPPTASGTAFVEIAKDGKPVAKSAVPFVVSGPSVVSVPKLVGLKEAIDVFGYADTRPEGGGKPEPKARPILKFDDDEVLTIGDPAPFVLGPAVQTGDLATAGRTSMSGTGLLITARPPKKKTPVPLPPPPPEN
ncbi:MAG TPA: hypothetical protein PLB01_12820 [Thermoanaerobaculia bacterium]|nr:hypothetical protein [Thermoanaerobaculia bacterium]